MAGLEKRNRILNPHERKVVAHHEMGHALVAMAIPGVDPVQKISLLLRIPLRICESPAGRWRCQRWTMRRSRIGWPGLGF